MSDKESDDDLVVLETMPDWLRESHRKANNWGQWPVNGAQREVMRRADAEEIAESDEDGYDHIVRVATSRDRNGMDAGTLARALFRDDMDRADETPVERNGYKAFDGWLQAAKDAADTQTRDALLGVDRDAFARAWGELVEEP